MVVRGVGDLGFMVVKKKRIDVYVGVVCCVGVGCGFLYLVRFYCEVI